MQLRPENVSGWESKQEGQLLQSYRAKPHQEQNGTFGLWTRQSCQLRLATMSSFVLIQVLRSGINNGQPSAGHSEGLVKYLRFKLLEILGQDWRWGGQKRAQTNCSDGGWRWVQNPPATKNPHHGCILGNWCNLGKTEEHVISHLHMHDCGFCFELWEPQRSKS